MKVTDRTLIQFDRLGFGQAFRDISGKYNNAVFMKVRFLEKLYAAVELSSGETREFGSGDIVQVLNVEVVIHGPVIR